MTIDEILWRFGFAVGFWGPIVGGLVLVIWFAVWEHRRSVRSARKKKTPAGEGGG